MVFEIDGEDITKYIAFSGLKFTVSDLDSEEAGRTLDGNLRRSRVATKVRWDVPTRPLKTSELQHLFSLIKKEWVTLRASDPYFGLRSARFYSNNYNVAMKISSKTSDNEELWDSITFPLIEE